MSIYKPKKWQWLEDAVYTVLFVVRLIAPISAVHYLKWSDPQPNEPLDPWHPDQKSSA